MLSKFDNSSIRSAASDLGLHCLPRSQEWDDRHYGLTSCLLQLDFSRHYLLNEPFYEIMVLFVLRKLILQTRMRSHPVGLDV